MTMASLSDKIDTLLRQRYQEAGAPYGDTEEGVDRWIDDILAKHHDPLRMLFSISQDQECDGTG
jgi:hypothetical protein